MPDDGLFSLPTMLALILGVAIIILAPFILDFFA